MNKNEIKRKSYVKTTSDTISIRQAMEISGVSRTTLDKWFKGDNNIKTYRQLNGQLLVNKNDFYQFINNKQGELNKE